MDINSTQKIIVSVTETDSVAIDAFNALPSFEKVFYFEQPDKGTIYWAFDSLTSFSSDNQYGFSPFQQRVQNTSMEFIEKEFEDLNFPVVFGGMMFPENNSGHNEEWCDYKSSDWFIPKHLLMIKKEKCFFISFSFSSVNAAVDLCEYKKRFPVTKGKILLKPVSCPFPNISKYKWHLLVDNAVNEIKKGSFSKVVLSRKTELEISDTFDFELVMEFLREKYHTCTLFIFKSGGSYFFGATPEKAASFKNGTAEFDALAGSAPRGFDKFTDSRYEKYLLNSSKDRDEHNYVIEYIKNEAAELVNEFTVTETIVKKLNNIQHLFTGISAEIKDPSLMFPLLDKVIPTPAVCGLPKDKALNFIMDHEGYTRGFYSGTIGWFNFRYEGEFMAALRSALYKKDKLSIFAGCGIVENSDPALEYEETELKMQPIMSIFYEN